MSRLIDADALADKVADLYTEGEEATEADKVVNDVIDLIDNAPTVEYPEQITVECDTEEDKQKLLSALRNVKLKAIVEDERPQGEWKDDKEYSYLANCSNCGYQMDTHEEHGYFNYCPNCGADMRKEAENDS